MVQKALLVVDMQNDFLPPKGSLAVSGGDTILANIHNLLAHSDEYCIIVATLVSTLKGLRQRAQV